MKLITRKERSLTYKIVVTILKSIWPIIPFVAIYLLANFILEPLAFVVRSHAEITYSNALEILKDLLTVHGVIIGLMILKK